MSVEMPGELHVERRDAAAKLRVRHLAVGFGAVASGITLGSMLWWMTPRMLPGVLGGAVGTGRLDDALAVSAVVVAASLTAVLCLRVVWAREREASRLLAELEARTRDLDVSREELRQLARFVSHELRQPLAALGIWTELLKSRCAPNGDEQVGRYLREISVTVQRIGALISGQPANQHARAIDPAPALDGARAEVKPAAAEHRTA